MKRWCPPFVFTLHSHTSSGIELSNHNMLRNGLIECPKKSKYLFHFRFDIRMKAPNISSSILNKRSDLYKNFKPRLLIITTRIYLSRFLQIHTCCSRKDYTPNDSYANRIIVGFENLTSDIS